MISIANFQSVRRILCLGAHADDIEIGAGGTILRIIEECPDVEFRWVVFSGDKRRQLEAKSSAELFLSNAASKRIETNGFRDGYFPYEGREIKDLFETLKQGFDPDLIFSHSLHDRHQDHRLIAELTWNTYRNHLVLEYEIPKFDGDLNPPNFFVPLHEAHWRKKINLLTSSFPSQIDKNWFTETTFSALMRLRGVESNAESGYAEGFHSRKIVL